MKKIIASISIATSFFVSGCATNSELSSEEHVDATLVWGSTCQGSLVIKNRFCPPLLVRTENGQEISVDMYTNAKVGESVVMKCDVTGNRYNCDDTAYLPE